VSDETGNPDSVASQSAKGDRSIDPLDPDAVITEAESLLTKGQLEDAEHQLQLGLKYRQHWEYYGVLGKVWAAQGRLQEAEGAFRHAVLLGGPKPRSHWLLGEFLLKKGELREAEGALRRAIALDADVSSFHSSLGALLLEQGWLDDARSSLMRSIRLNRQNPRPREILAKLLIVELDYSGARKMLLKGLKFSPKSRSILVALSKLCEERGRTEEAIQYSVRILELDPSNTYIQLRLSDQYKSVGRLADAERVMRAALALRPTAVNYVRLSEILEAQTRICEAVTALAEACKLAPKNSAYRDQHAKLSISRASGPASDTIKPDDPKKTWLRRLLALSKKH
jgi:tetratricopeptide (TPR) repeat protein